MSANELVFPYDINPSDCERFGGSHVKDADTVTENPEIAVEEDFAGACVFESRANFLRAKILYLLFSPNIDRVDDPEALSIRIQNPKSEDFDFLKSEATTVYGNTGYWRGLVEENTEHEVVFFDQADESVGQELLDTLSTYNEEVVGETVLYVDIVDLDSTSLEPPFDYPHNL